MNSSLSLTTITEPAGRFLGRYHATIFFTVIILLLAGAILTLYLSVSTTKGTESVQGEIISSTFDQETANEIQQLRDSDETATSLIYPSRSNPFVE